MLFSKVGVYKAEQDGQLFIVELGHEADDSADLVHISNPLAADEVRNLLRHVEMSDAEIEDKIRFASKPRTAAASAS